MTAEAEPSRQTITAHLKLTILGQTVTGDVEMPAEPVRLIDMLPAFQSLADIVVGIASDASVAEGKPISCKAGCGACCRQLVPIAEVEARRIRDLVDDLPEPRRSLIQKRFAEARRSLDEGGLLETLEHPEGWTDDDRQPIGLKYFAQGIACPFLENESCSIYEDRPIACREYLVTSPAENCAHPSAEGVRCVPMPAKLWSSVARLDPVPEGQRTIRWVPLILAPEWAANHLEESDRRPAPEYLRGLIERITGAVLPPAPDPGASP